MPTDVLMGLGWLPQSGLDRWRQGRAAFLEEEISADLDKLWAALRLLHRWAERRDLRPSEAASSHTAAMAPWAARSGGHDRRGALSSPVNMSPAGHVR